LKIAVLSGKGGTGKTFIATNMAAVAQESTYVDCDVEEPNGHLFLRPKEVQVKSVTVPIPVVNEALCNGCRKCVDFCRFGALAYTGRGLIVLDDICHSCGGCVLLCPENALTERKKTVGEIHEGVSRSIKCITGVLHPGEASGVPVISKLLQGLDQVPTPVLIDCPPGSACTVMESIRDADYCILVAEPSLFGVHNLAMVWELVQLFQKPYGVVLNKCLPGDNPAETFCCEREIKILARIPFSHGLGFMNSQGIVAVWEDRSLHTLFAGLLERVAKEVQREYEAVAYP